ncbi:MAG TPA: hypothetical protein VH834_19615 [Solirubrobacteraceae bacterium]|jgi:hypothetical protein
MYHRRITHILAVELAAIATFAAASATAQPAYDHPARAAQHAYANKRDHSPRATRPSITLTNPLGRSRGLGAGMGLL